MAGKKKTGNEYDEEYGRWGEAPGAVTITKPAGKKKPATKAATAKKPAVKKAAGKKGK